jgi:hypothetical protein
VRDTKALADVFVVPLALFALAPLIPPYVSSIMVLSDY